MLLNVLCSFAIFVELLCVKYFLSSFRKDNTRVKELFNTIEKLRQEFESIKRPNIEMENPIEEPASPSSEKSLQSPSHPSATSAADTREQKPEKSEQPKSPVVKGDQVLDTEAELAKLESEFGKVNREYTAEEIGGWEFDELEKELSK